jgi:hypothetical protein
VSTCGVKSPNNMKEEDICFFAFCFFCERFLRYLFSVFIMRRPEDTLVFHLLLSIPSLCGTGGCRSGVYVWGFRKVQERSSLVWLQTDIIEFISFYIWFACLDVLSIFDGRDV